MVSHNPQHQPALARLETKSFNICLAIIAVPGRFNPFSSPREKKKVHWCLTLKDELAGAAVALRGNSMAVTQLLFKRALWSGATGHSQPFALTKPHGWWGTDAFTISFGFFF